MRMLAALSVITLSGASLQVLSLDGLRIAMEKNHQRSASRFAVAMAEATAIANLRGKNTLISSRSGENAGLGWMEMLLAKEQLGRAASFFSSVKVTDRPRNLDVAKEMNPQLAQPQVLARYQPLIEAMIALPVQPHPYQEKLTEAILSVHESSRRRQALMVMRTDRTVRLHPGDMDSARELWRDNYRLPGSVPNHTPVAPGAAEERR